MYKTRVFPVFIQFTAIAMILVALGSRLLSAQTSAKSAVAVGEVHKYRLLWPSGVAMGEAQISSSMKGGNWVFEFRVDADLPVYPLSSAWTSRATPKELCSLELHRKTTEGTKIAEDSITFDQQSLSAKRTRGDVVATFTTPACARDPLNFLFYFMERMRDRGKVAEESFFINSDQSLGMHSGGTESVTIGGQQIKAEKFSVELRGGSKTTKFDVWISQDGRGIPLLVRLPTPLAVFSAELVQ